MPIQGYTPNKSLVKIAQNSTDNWDAWQNQNLDTLDEPVLTYNSAAAENLAAFDVAVIKDDGTGAKKSYLANSAAYVFGDPLGVVLAQALAGEPVRLALEGRVQDGAWSFGPSDKFVYLSSAGAITVTPTGVKVGYVLSATAIYFIPPIVSGGQTDTVTASNGLQNTGDNVNAVIAPVYGSSANTVCQGNDARLHNQNSDAGTSAVSFEINYTGNSARLLTTGLTANRDYTLPDATTKLVGESSPAAITAQHSFSPASAQAPFTLGANAQGQVVTGLNADQLDGADASAFAVAAKGVTNGDSHDHTGGDGSAINLASAVTGVLPIANGGTGSSTASAARSALSAAQSGANSDITSLSALTSVNGGPFAKNVAINGGFTVNQRGYVSAATLASGAYGHDRWKAGAGGGDYSFTQLASDTTITIASGKTLIQVVEDKNVQYTSYALSWTGSAQARYAVNSAIPAGAYASSPILITGQNAGTVMSVEFSAGTLGKVQLEQGSVSTPFEHHPYQQGLSLCQRYYWQMIATQGPWLDGYASGAGMIQAFSYTHPVTMRIAPTLTIVGAWTLTNLSGQPNIASSDTQQWALYTTSAAAGKTRAQPASAASTGITASAEL